MFDDEEEGDEWEALGWNLGEAFDRVGIVDAEYKDNGDEDDAKDEEVIYEDDGVVNNNGGNGEELWFLMMLLMLLLLFEENNDNDAAPPPDDDKDNDDADADADDEDEEAPLKDETPDDEENDEDDEDGEEAVLKILLRVPPLNMALTSSHLWVSSWSCSRYSLRCLRQELKLAASGWLYLAAGVRWKWKMNLLGEKYMLQ